MKLLSTADSKSVSGGVFMDKFENTYHIYISPNEIFGLKLNGKTFLFDVNGVYFEEIPTITQAVTAKNFMQFGLASLAIANNSGYAPGSVKYTLTLA